MKNATEILEKGMNPNQRINYHTVLEKLIKKFEKKQE